VHRTDWVNTRLRVDACDSDGCTASNEVGILGSMLDAIGYFKASSNTGRETAFGLAVALSADGNTLAVGRSQDSPDPPEPTAVVHVFTRSGTTWAQQTSFNQPRTEDGFRLDTEFGMSVALSADGNTLAMGGGGRFGGGGVFLSIRTGTTWAQPARIKILTSGGQSFGVAGTVALSADGNTLAVGTGTDVTPTTNIGAVYVFTRTGFGWAQEALLTAPNSDVNDAFGISVALSADGNTLVAGGRGDVTTANGIGGEDPVDLRRRAGAAYVFTRAGTTWAQQAFVKASNPGVLDDFGWSVALSADGNTLAVGARNESSDATGINGNQANDSFWFAGAAYVFVRAGLAWAEQAYVKASNTAPYNTDIGAGGDRFGWSVALSADGNMLAVGALAECSDAAGIDNNQANRSFCGSGAVYTFTRTGATWVQQAYVKASNTGQRDAFGNSVALSADGNTLAVGARGESSATTGIGGNRLDNSRPDSGAVYLY
jgi:hypothetical protein